MPTRPIETEASAIAAAMEFLDGVQLLYRVTAVRSEQDYWVVEFEPGQESWSQVFVDAYDGSTSFLTESTADAALEKPK